jgi:DNA-binding transcriptional MerR regulator
VAKQEPERAIPNAHYRVQEFAELGGVTVKALRHYDRLGLLVPARTPAGHRRYSTADRERLRRLLALKGVGVALRRIGPLLDADHETLINHLAVSRAALAHERERLRRADRAIALVQESLRHTPVDSRGLSVLADAIDIPQAAAAMRRYFSDDVWDVARRFYEEWPSEEWISFCRDVAANLSARPGSPCAEDLLRRWNGLAQLVWHQLPADPHRSRQLHDGFARAWRDRDNWSDTIKRRFADYRLDDVAAFVGRVSTVLHDRPDRHV